VVKKRVLCVLGTRPEAIKMAPVIQRLRGEAHLTTRVLATAQHREMLDQVLSLFNIQPDLDLNIMRPNQPLHELTSRLLLKLDHVLRDEQPDVVLAQGDTTSVMVMALSCFYHKIPFGHVEAGLRTRNLYYPFPEEMNRIVAGHLARWHFAPTERARSSLLREGIEPEAIHVTGNTVIDALLQIADQVDDTDIGIEMDTEKRLILVTAHRRENFGEPFRQICHAIRRIADSNEDIQILYPVHPNPNIVGPAYEILSGHPRILLCSPLDYKSFVAAMKRAYLILTDSGGIQEEAPALGKPVLVLRQETERPEAVDEGVVWMVGVDFETIVEKTCLLLRSNDEYKRVARKVSPYGDGHAAEKIVNVLLEDLV
jgi:UDP-N-acetylglucosamine 2-epimerase (non-hydrolysing)